MVSLTTDISSEMIYPLMPLFLATVLGAGRGFIGVVEGAAEATASLLKLVSGRLSDRVRRRKPLTVLGYAISSLARPLVGLARAPWMVLVVRLFDRLGKGIRTSPRDALVADVTPAQGRGRAYGFHRAMDNAGAVIGPAVATLLLGVFHLPLRSLFLWSAVPAAIAMAVLVGAVREQERRTAPTTAAATPQAGRPPHLAAYLTVVGLFALGNSSDAFLLLRARELGVRQALIPAIWMVHNASKALLSTAGGALSDRAGRRGVIAAGFGVYALSYLGFGAASAAWQAWPLFILYGLYYALTEGSERALVADLAGPSYRGRAFGYYHAIVGMAALPASVGFGVLTERYGSRLPFLLSAGLAAVAAALLITLVPNRARFDILSRCS